MPQRAWSNKRERQYEHIKEGLVERGTGEERAEEIAARTVNKERARHGETQQAGRTYDQLRNEAKERGIKGRSRMNKEELQKVLSR
jgi:plasmid stabilization system protein ParE